MLKQQTSKLLADGGMMQEGGSVDPVSGNNVPVGAMKEEVRDDIPAQLSEGEFVFPADVVRYIGLERLMQMRQAAKQGLMKMEDMGQMSNGEEGSEEEDTAEFESELDEIMGEMGNEPKEMAVGGMATEGQPMAQPVPAAVPQTPQDAQMQDMQRVAAAPASSMSSTQIIKQDMGEDPTMAKDLLGKVATNKAVLMRDSNTVFIGETLDYGVVKLHTFTADTPETLPAATTKIIDTLKTAGVKEIQGSIKDPAIIPALEQAGYTPEVTDTEFSIKLEGAVV
jgi:hypothetical protein